MNVTPVECLPRRKSSSLEAPYVHSHMGYSSKALKGIIEWVIYGSILGVIKEDVRGFDYGLFGSFPK